MSRKQCPYSYEDIISVENLLFAWQEFMRGKRNKIDVQGFQRHLMDNIIALHRDLKNMTYRHRSYRAFKINDPKPRDIHKAGVRDRLVHHALYRVLYPFFDRAFIADSYSCRMNKGTHRATNKLREYAYVISKNHTRTCWVLKCDIKKFFASVDHGVLKQVLARRITNVRILQLLDSVIDSFPRGLPLGNLTSQLLVNIYMGEFDMFVKHKLKAKYYIRYADDFIILSRDRCRLESLMPQIDGFLSCKLKLTLHPRKVSIATFASGVDFLGWLHFPDHRVLRTSTKRRVLKRCDGRPIEDVSVQAHLGLLKHGNARKIMRRLFRQDVPGLSFESEIYSQHAIVPR